MQNFTVEDFRFISEFLSSFDAVVSTPYSLAEVSNLLNVSSRRTHEKRVIETYIQVIQNIDEVSVSSRQVVARQDFELFGLADSAWLEYLDAHTLFLSADEALVNSANAQGKKAAWFKPSRQ